MKHLQGINLLTRLGLVEATVHAVPPASSRSTTTSFIFSICLFGIICIHTVPFTWGSQMFYKQFNLSSLIQCWKACSPLSPPQLPACNPPLGRLSNQSCHSPSWEVFPAHNPKAPSSLSFKPSLKSTFAQMSTTLKQTSNLANGCICGVLRLLPVIPARNTLLNLLYPTMGSLLLLLGLYDSWGRGQFFCSVSTNYEVA